MKKLGLDQNTLDDIIQRVVEVAQPLHGYVLQDAFV